MKTTLLLAGNYEQFLSWRREHPGVEARYLSRAEQLLGLDFRTVQVVRYGTWYARWDIDRIMVEIEYRERVAVRSRNP